MENHGINMKGSLFLQIVSTKPANSSTNKGRIIYVEDEATLYFGNSTQWIKFYSTGQVDSLLTAYYTSSQVDTLLGNYVSKVSNSNVDADTEWQDGFKARFGNGADMQIYHSGGINFIDCAQGLYIRMDGENSAYFADDGGVYLYYNDILTANTYLYGSVYVFEARTFVSNGSRSYVNESDGSDIHWFMAGTPSTATESGTPRSNYLGFRSQSGDITRAYEVWVDVDFRCEEIYPTGDAVYDLGSSTNTRRFDNVYITGSFVDESDERVKKDIKTSDLGLNFIDELSPVSYIKRDTTSKNEVTGEKITSTHHRRHYGLIAQDVKGTLDKLNIDTEDFAGYKYDPDGDMYGLAYTEFISPLIKAVQELSAEVKDLRAEVNKLKSS